jgi:hypothetical protein
VEPVDELKAQRDRHRKSQQKEAGERHPAIKFHVGYKMRRRVNETHHHQGSEKQCPEAVRLLLQLASNCFRRSWSHDFPRAGKTVIRLSISEIPRCTGAAPELSLPHCGIVEREAKPPRCFQLVFNYA